MRINNSSPSIYHINQRNNLTNNKELFKSTLLVQTVEKKEDEEKKDKSVEKKGQLVTAREGAYTRQYLVNSDGSKVLLSETKHAEGEATSTENYSRFLSNSNKNQNDDGMSNNSKEIVSLLNQQIVNFNQPKTTN
ncbi:MULTISPECIES: hypothetical protein [Paenibacillus]|uniref:hypothetical protein n=1 Tax=Paenibacillus TaxID=44249 RepID=UPI00096E85ED|nr:hypothetical protein [Paenibacillus amylolyticus]OMF41212.1 hypothetical protein BK136_21820 [Paenibacillus amylolyticus]